MMNVVGKYFRREMFVPHVAIGNRRRFIVVGTKMEVSM
jgi:hypothetical protein